MGKARVILVVLGVCLCLAAADLWLLGKIHFCRLWLTREQSQEERQALESKAKNLTIVFVMVNLSAVGVLAALGIHARTKGGRGGTPRPAGD